MSEEQQNKEGSSSQSKKQLRQLKIQGKLFLKQAFTLHKKFSITLTESQTEELTLVLEETQSAFKSNQLTQKQLDECNKTLEGIRSKSSSSNEVALILRNSLIN